MRRRHRRTVAAASLGAVLAALALAPALLTACSSPATVGAGGSGAPSPSVAASPTGGGAASPAAAGGSGKGISGPDWTRVLDILASMRAAPPTEPVVVLLGGSAARESTVSDASWRNQIRSAGGPAALAWNLGSRNRTMAQNVAIVKALPRVPGIVFIGVNLGAFTSAQRTATLPQSAPAPSASPSLQQPHQYAQSHILSAANKRMLVQAWLADRSQVFRHDFSTSAGVLASLIRVCQARGYHPVLLELPRDTAVIGGRLDAPTNRFRAECKALAATYHVPWVSFVDQARIPDSSFYDLWHLVEPGRTIWQKLLSDRTAALLKQYKLGGGGS
jgi:hypothetical protein